MMKFEEKMNLNFRFLDTIDFTPYLETCDDVRELCSRVETTIVPETVPKELDGFVFDCLTEDDVAEYLKKRYGNDWYIWDEVIIKHYITRKSDS